MANAMKDMEHDMDHACECCGKPAETVTAAEDVYLCNTCAAELSRYARSAEAQWGAVFATVRAARLREERGDLTQRERQILKEICEAPDTIGTAVMWIARLEKFFEAEQERRVKASAAQATLESAIGVRGNVLLAYGDTFGQIASRLDIPIAGLWPEEAGPRLAAAVDRLALELQTTRRDNDTLQDDLGELLSIARDAWETTCAPVGAGVTVEPTPERERIAMRLFEVLRQMGAIDPRGD